MNTARRWVLVTVILSVLAGAAVSVVCLRSRRAALVVKEETRQRRLSEKYKRPALSIVVRSGLPNLRRKLDNRQPVTLGFVGGSITANAGEGGFVSEIPAWLSSRAPGLSVQTINAGIPATDSGFGAQRVDRDILVHRPDVVFIEFAVNDAGRECQADMERLVRKIRMAEPAPEIVLLYTMSKDDLPGLESGDFPKSVKRHESVAEYYDVPTVALGYEADQRIRNGRWTWADFSKDSCHPTNEGYESYNVDIARALPALIDKAKPSSRALPPPLTAGLVAYPPVAIATPQPNPRPLLDDQGTPASQTYELPLFGVQWIGAPAFPTPSAAVWSLLFRSFDPTAPADATDGLNRREWKPMEWFDEARSFTARTSLPLAQSKDGVGNLLGANASAQAVLTWQASSTGRCLLHASASGIEGVAVSSEAHVLLNIVRFPSHGEQGESQTFHTTQRSEMLDLDKTFRVSLGDTVAFVFHPIGYKFASYRGFKVTIGVFNDDADKGTGAP